jgi:alkaline phosphatase
MYESLREKGSDGHPSLSEMTKAAIKILDNNKNTNGYLLMVEGGKIDQAHHQNYARLALEEMVEFDRAIQEAVEMTTDDTLIIVTADHAHSMIFNGYPTRGNDIFGVLSKPGAVDYETLVYATGPGFFEHTGNKTNSSFMSMSEFTPEMRAEPTYKHSSMIGMSDAVHSGEDVGVFATGPGSSLVQGVFEQSYIPYIISFSSCIGPLSHQNPACRGEKLKNKADGLKRNLVLLLTLNFCIFYRGFL